MIVAAFHSTWLSGTAIVTTVYVKLSAIANANAIYLSWFLALTLPKHYQQISKNNPV